MTTPLTGASASHASSYDSHQASATIANFSTMENYLEALPPRYGHLQILRTKAEAESGLNLVPAHIVSISPQDANKALIAIDAALPPSSISNLQHLRRVAKPQFLSSEARQVLGDVSIPSSAASSANTSASRSSAGSERSSSSDSAPLRPRRNRLRNRRSNSSATRKLYIAAAPTSVITEEQLEEVLKDYEHKFFILDVPSTPPANQDEAQAWSEFHWPSVYRAHNPFGPQPAFVSRGEGIIAKTAGMWIALADKIAEESKTSGMGAGFSAVIVDSNADWNAPVAVAAAGDARWVGVGNKGQVSTEVGCNGNPASHAVMRAIGMIARQRVALGGKVPRKVAKSGDDSEAGLEETRPSLLNLDKPRFKELRPEEKEASTKETRMSEVHVEDPVPINDGASQEKSKSSIFNDRPLTDLEAFIYNNSLLPAGGYLCSGLEMWLSHEPCVMCSMAILHSRFERVVFTRRMPKTGAMVGETRGRAPQRKNEGVNTASGSDGKISANESEAMHNTALGYGLFWRPELNWKMLTWEWIEDDSDPGSTTSASTTSSNSTRRKKKKHAVSKNKRMKDNSENVKFHA